jgi:hypothetical protein
MKTLTYGLFIALLITWVACKDDDDAKVFEYHSHIYQPDESDKHMGDTLAIHVEFESHTGEIVHQINVQIFNATTHAVVYDQPVDSHVNTSVSYEFEDSIILSTANGFSEGDWVIQAKVWGESDGEQEEVESVNFHIHN